MAIANFIMVKFIVVKFGNAKKFYILENIDGEFTEK